VNKVGRRDAGIPRPRGISSENDSLSVGVNSPLWRVHPEVAIPCGKREGMPMAEKRSQAGRGIALMPFRAIGPRPVNL
jgi:hypothetical protein